jgi:hypothetical protein
VRLAAQLLAFGRSLYLRDLVDTAGSANFHAVQSFLARCIGVEHLLLIAMNLPPASPPIATDVSDICTCCAEILPRH